MKNKIGFVGLGKLGLPCALAINNAGYSVHAYDLDQSVKNILKTRTIPYREEGADELLKKHTITWGEIPQIVKNSDIIFVPIQTPHEDLYEGVTRLPTSRKDFDYTWLKRGVEALSAEIEKQKEEKIVIIISTVLPGTIRREIKPLLGQYTTLCYNPFFIAMGTTIQDFTNPEFVLLGMDNQNLSSPIEDFYASLHKRPVYKCTIEEAELIKVSYNTYITMKICLANTIMEVAHKLENIDCDNVMRGLFLGNKRLISNKYLLGGMGDGGACHPRDNIALSWLARELDLSYDWYESLMICRENQTEWLADLVKSYKEIYDLPVVILGKCFKKETNLTIGSPSILLKNILEEKNLKPILFDPYVDSGKPPLSNKAIFFIGTNHDVFLDYKFPKGSIVIDPWRQISSQNDIKLIQVGKN